jgi:hypothetical protein
MFFFDRNIQRTLAFNARAEVESAAENKSFLLLFFKKEVLSFFKDSAICVPGS